MLFSAVVSLTKTNAVVTATGTLTVSDVDNAAQYTPATVSGTYGSLTIDAAGAWSYTASSAHNEFVKDQVYSDTFTVSAVDGDDDGEGGHHRDERCGGALQCGGPLTETTRCSRRRAR